MTATASGTAAISLVQLRTMLSHSLTFRNGGTQGAALQRVHIGRQVGQLARPCAVLRTDLSGQAIGWGEENILRPSGQISVLMERDTDLAASDVYIDATTWFGKVIDEVNDMAGDDDVSSQFGLTHLPLVTMQLSGLSENSRSTWHSLGRFHTATILWTWGDT